MMIILRVPLLLLLLLLRLLPLQLPPSNTIPTSYSGLPLFIADTHRPVSPQSERPLRARDHSAGCARKRRPEALTNRSADSPTVHRWRRPNPRNATTSTATVAAAATSTAAAAAATATAATAATTAIDSRSLAWDHLV